MLAITDEQVETICMVAVAGAAIGYVELRRLVRWHRERRRNPDASRAEFEFDEDRIFRGVPEAQVRSERAESQADRTWQLQGYRRVLNGERADDVYAEYLTVCPWTSRLSQTTLDAYRQTLARAEAFAGGDYDVPYGYPTPPGFETCLPDEKFLAAGEDVLNGMSAEDALRKHWPELTPKAIEKSMSVTVKTLRYLEQALPEHQPKPGGVDGPTAR